MFDWFLNTPVYRDLVFEKFDQKCQKQGDDKKYLSMLNDWVVESHKRNWQIFMNIRTIFQP